MFIIILIHYRHLLIASDSKNHRARKYYLLQFFVKFFCFAFNVNITVHYPIDQFYRISSHFVTYWALLAGIPYWMTYRAIIRKLCFVFIMISEEKVVVILKGAFSGLRQLVATESPLKIMKNTFFMKIMKNFTLKALFILKEFKFLS